MSVKTDLRYSHYSIGHLSVDPSRIYGKSSPDMTYLDVPLELLLKPLDSQSEDEATRGKLYRHFTLMCLWADLYFCSFSKEILLAKGISKPILQLSKDWAESHSLLLPISRPSLNHLEKNRQGEIQFKIRFEYLLALHPKRTKENIGRDDLGVSDFYKDRGELIFEIAKSQWVEKILPELGWGNSKLVEIRTPQQAIPERYQKTLKAFDQAQDYLNRGDYPQVVAHCRKALEAIPTAAKLKFPQGTNPNYHDKVDQFLSKLTLSQTQSDSIKTMLKAMWSMTSKPHHTNAIFSRADAEFSITVTAALLAYLGEQV